MLSNLRTAHYLYLPALALPTGERIQLSLNSPPSFHEPYSVLVSSLPAVGAPQLPPLRPVDPKAQYCYDLCTSETQLAKFQLALNACKKVGLHDPTPELKAKADTQMQAIRDQAKAANVDLE